MDAKEIENHINSKIKDKTIWAAVSGYGSFFYLELGKKILKRQETQNENLPEDIRKFKGEFNLSFWGSWRLENNGKIIKSWKDVVELDPELFSLVGSKIEYVKVNDICDLLIKFDSGKSLSVFCDDQEEECWGFVDGKEMHSVKFNHIEISDYLI
jgi:hypothetical protein